MGLFTRASQTVLAVNVPASKTMQTVFDETVDKTERNRIVRLGDFYSTPLSALDGNGVDLLTWFDAQFPPLKEIGAGQIPGSNRNFWRSKSSYAKWREVVRRRIRATLGRDDEKKALRERIDGWTPFLALLEDLSKDHGPVHPGNVRSHSHIFRSCTNRRPRPDGPHARTCATFPGRDARSRTGSFCESPKGALAPSRVPAGLGFPTVRFRPSVPLL